MTRIPGKTGRRPCIAVRIVWLAATATVLALAGSAVSGQQPAGRIKTTSGTAFIVRSGASAPARVGAAVLEADLLRTGNDGYIGLTLKDDTRIALGPGSEVRLDRFIYAPAEGQLGLILNVVRGVIAYVSGRIAKLAPDAVRLRTPTAIVGVRGTTLALRVGEK